jgi:hypothetical protein
VGFVALLSHSPDPFFQWASGRAGTWITKMATQPRKRRLGPKVRRALEMLASRPFGVTERLMLARGFSRRMLLGLVNQGFATLAYEMDGKIFEVGKMQITAAGRHALAAEH